MAHPTVDPIPTTPGDSYRRVLAGLVCDFKDTVVIAVGPVLNAALGFVQEHRAERGLAALRQMLVATATVRRGGALRQVPAEELVPGDVVLVEAGDRIPADGRLVAAASLEIDESALTGGAPTARGSTIPCAASGSPPRGLRPSSTTSGYGCRFGASPDHRSARSGQRRSPGRLRRRSAPGAPTGRAPGRGRCHPQRVGAIPNAERVEQNRTGHRCDLVVVHLDVHIEHPADGSAVGRPDRSPKTHHSTGLRVLPRVGSRVCNSPTDRLGATLSPGVHDEIDPCRHRRFRHCARRCSLGRRSGIVPRI